MQKIGIAILWVAIGFIPSILRAQPVCMEPKTDYLAGTGSKSICAADFNGDGKPDLALGNYASGLSVVLNNGAGGFGAPTGIATGVLPWSLCSADFNGDGKADLATHNNGPGTVSILLGNGTGGFGADIGFGTGLFNNGVSICTGDFDGNGDPDLAIASGFNYMIIALGNGDGTFDSTTQFSTGGGRSILSADFNGDGKADLATTQSLMLGNGTGGFAAPVALSLSATPMSITGADFNGDGKIDLASANMENNITGSFSVALGNGNGTFAAANTFAADSNTVPKLVSSGDFNGDGKVDLASAAIFNNNSGKAIILLGNGSGAFGAPAYFAVDNFPNALVCTDLNVDGKPDLAFATAQSNADTAGQACILLNCNTLGVDEANYIPADISIFPNPAAGTFTVSCPGNMDELKVMDLLGKVLYQIHPNTQSQALSLTENGIYFVLVSSQKQTFLKKVVITR